MNDVLVSRPSLLILYINLDASEHRRDAMEQQFKGLDIPYQRVPAIDGQSVFGSLSVADRKRFLQCHGRDLRPGELGCYMSHLKAMQFFLDTDYEYVIICEDDAVIVDHDVVFRLIFSDSSDEKWDFLRLHSRRNPVRVKVSVAAGGVSYFISFTRSTGSAAYALNRKAAQRLLHALRRIEVPFDHAFDRPHQFNLRYRHVFPLPVSLREAPSSIETSKPKKLPFYRKLPTLGWRAKTETSRFFWALRSVLTER